VYNIDYKQGSCFDEWEKRVEIEGFGVTIGP
jgi:hypothetical protein